MYLYYQKKSYTTNVVFFKSFVFLTIVKLIINSLEINSYYGEVLTLIGINQKVEIFYNVVY